MLTDPRKNLLALADNPELENLLARAREKAAAAAPAPSPLALAPQAHVEKAATAAQKLATDLATSLRATAAEGSASRTQKVAMLRHMIDVGARVLA